MKNSLLPRRGESSAGHPGQKAVDKEDVKAKLLAYEPELKAAGIVHLHLHGSVVRGESGPDSDVDL